MLSFLTLHPILSFMGSYGSRGALVQPPRGGSPFRCGKIPSSTQRTLAKRTRRNGDPRKGQTHLPLRLQPPLACALSRFIEYLAWSPKLVNDHVCAYTSGAEPVSDPEQMYISALENHKGLSALFYAVEMATQKGIVRTEDDSPNRVQRGLTGHRTLLLHARARCH